MPPSFFACEGCAWWTQTRPYQDGAWKGIGATLVLFPKYVSLRHLKQFSKKLITLFVVAAQPQQQTTGQSF
jgi:hypothetical protein